MNFKSCLSYWNVFSAHEWFFWQIKTFYILRWISFHNLLKILFSGWTIFEFSKRGTCEFSDGWKTISRLRWINSPVDWRIHHVETNFHPHERFWAGKLIIFQRYELKIFGPTSQRWRSYKLTRVRSFVRPSVRLLPAFLEIDWMKFYDFLHDDANL